MGDGGRAHHLDHPHRLHSNGGSSLSLWIDLNVEKVESDGKRSVDLDLFTSRSLVCLLFAKRAEVSMRFYLGAEGYLMTCTTNVT
jgi:hypothetical protein